MTDSSWLTELTTGLADPRLAATVAIALLTGVVRGFSGFGAGLIYVPLVSAAYQPTVAAATIFLIDTVIATPFTVRSVARCNWHDVLPLALAASVMVPVGAAALKWLDPITMRWIIAVIVAGALVVLAAGWRYHGRPRLPITLGVGALAGVLGGATQMSGPPVIAYWLGGAIPASLVRDNLMVFFLLASVTSGLTYLAQGLLTTTAIKIALVAGPAYGLGMLVGAKLFHGASDVTYRRIAYLIIAAAALLSLPVFDRFVR